MSPEHIGQQIRKARKNAGMTQEQLAATLHISRQTVSSWENARSQPDYQMLQTLAALLGMNLAEVFGMSPAEAMPAQEAQMPQPDSPPETQSPEANAPAQVVQPAQEEAPGSQVVQPGTPAQDAQPVVQPDTRRSRFFRLILPVTAMLALILLGMLLWHSRSSAPQYTRAWFDQSRVPITGQAYIDVYAKQDVIPLSPATKNQPPVYSYHFFLREMQGVGFQPEYIRFLHFFEDGSYDETLFDKAVIATLPGHSSHINAHGIIRISGQYFLTDGKAPVGVGCVIEGSDDANNALAFGTYVPFAPN